MDAVEPVSDHRIQNALFAISEAALTAPAMGHLYARIHQILAGLTDASHFSVALYDEASGRVSFTYVAAQKEFSLPARPLEELPGIAAAILGGGEGVSRGPELFAGLPHPVPSLAGGLAVPLTARRKVLGALVAGSPTRPFNASEEQLLTFAAQQISLALARSLAQEAEHQRTSELAILNSVGEAMAKTLDLKFVTRLVGDKIRDIFSATSVEIMLLDRATNLIHIPYEFDEAEGGYLENVQPFPLGTGLASKVITSGEPLLLGTLEEEIAHGAYFPPELLEHSAGQLGLSWLGVPIVVGDQVMGVLALADMSEHAFNENHLHLLQILSTNVGVAIENARLFEAEQQRNLELLAVNMLSTALVSELDLESLIQFVGEQTRSLFDADIAYLALLDEKRETIHFRYTYGEDLDPIPFGEGLTSTVIEANRPLLINQELNRQVVEIGASLIGQQALSYLGVPIFVGSQAVGVLSVQSVTREGMFGDKDMELLSTIASTVGLALRNAQLYAAARAARADAEHANAAKSAFLANMSHELRTPLNAIVGFTRIVRRKTEGLIPDRQTENLDKVLFSAENLLSLINTILDIAKIEAGRMDVMAASFRIHVLIDLCANTAQPLLKPGVVLEKDVDDTLTYVYSDQDKIRQIVLNLVSNAAKFTPRGKIVLAARREGENQLRISVVDTGIGISAEALPRIFKEFEQADSSTTRQYGGTGLGLAISRNLARLLGGDITAESVPGQGSTFTLILPLHYSPLAASMESTT